MLSLKGTLIVATLLLGLWVFFLIQVINIIRSKRKRKKAVEGISTCGLCKHYVYRDEFGVDYCGLLSLAFDSYNPRTGKPYYYVKKHLEDLNGDLNCKYFERWRGHYDTSDIC